MAGDETGAPMTSKTYIFVHVMFYRALQRVNLVEWIVGLVSGDRRREAIVTPR